MGLLEEESVTREVDSAHERAGSVDQFHRDVLQSIPLPVIATTLEGSVMLWNGAAARLWNRPEGEATGKKLAALNLPGLAGDLLIEKSSMVRDGRSDREWSQGSLGRPSDAQPMQVSVEVSPLRDPTGEKTGLLYVVHDVTSVRQVESELRRANEERQTAYEELQTINEEMQSSNEELETTNEELQSTNAELDATNRELAHRTEEMNKLAFNQRAIIRSLSAAVIVLNESGHITMWNLAAERLLGLTEGEALGQVLWTLHIPALDRSVLAKVRKALGQKLGTRSEDIAYETPSGGTGKATLSAVPILDGGAAMGAVLIFEDATKVSSLAAENARLKETNNRGTQNADR